MSDPEPPFVDESSAAELWLDERGKRCPEPVIALARAAAKAAPLAIMGVLSDDPAAQYDIPAWCRMKGMDLLRTSPAPDGAGGTAFVVQVPPVSSSQARSKGNSST